jgi:hypothetical protein
MSTAVAAADFGPVPEHSAAPDEPQYRHPHINGRRLVPAAGYGAERV